MSMIEQTLMERINPTVLGLLCLPCRGIKWNRQSSDLLGYLVNSLNYRGASHCRGSRQVFFFFFLPR